MTGRMVKEMWIQSKVVECACTRGVLAVLHYSRLPSLVQASYLGRTLLERMCTALLAAEC